MTNSDRIKYKTPPFNDITYNLLIYLFIKYKLKTENYIIIIN